MIPQNRRPLRSFWLGRPVLLTGHTGFKGTWMALLLHQLGADIHGISLAPPTDPSLFRMLSLPIASTELDIRDAAALARGVRAARPSVVIHMAAQPLVRESYRDPAGTFATNVGGTVNLLESLRDVPDLAAILAITTDKVYRNDGRGTPFLESDPLGGHDPYSASKAAAELAVASWRAAVPGQKLATARAGNVIGGGDFAPNRLIPDIVRALQHGETLLVRYPDATRPWQHVLDVLVGYLLQIEDLVANPSAPDALNFGPAEAASMRVSDVIAAFSAASGRRVPWRVEPTTLAEAPALALDASRAMAALGWRPRSQQAAIAATAAWYAAWMAGEPMPGRTADEAAAVLAA